MTSGQNARSGVAEIADALSAAFLKWKGCLPSQCVKQCPKQDREEAKKGPLCRRLAEHYAGAIQSINQGESHERET